MTNRRASHIRRYGITPAQYLALLSAQDGKCAICRSDSAGGPTKNDTWMIDHDHATGAVRGLLCCQCNFVLGYAKDSVEVLGSAIEYITSRR